jgi:hypothetical protein
MSILGGQKWSKFDDEKVTQKVSKNDRFWRVKNGVKNDEKMSSSGGGSGGAQMIKNRPRGPGTPNMEFFEISALFAKTLQFRTPKNDPYKMIIPHK